MPAAEALADPGVLLPGPLVEFQDCEAVARQGGISVLAWRDRALAARAAGLEVLSDGAQLAAGAHDQAVVHLTKSRAATLVDLAQAWRCVRPGGRVLVCGDNQLGITGFLKRLAAGGPLEVVANRGRGRIAALVRDQRELPAAEPAAHVRLPDAFPALALRVDAGVFSADGLDQGTRLLLSCLERRPAPRLVLDLGCGAGHLAIAALTLWPECRALLADGDARAVACAGANLERLGLGSRAEVRWWDAEEPLAVADCDLALINPPWHRGVAVDLSPARGMFRTARQALRPRGRALVVANRTLPYEADLAAWGEVGVVVQEAGFKVIEVIRASEPGRQGVA